MPDVSSCAPAVVRLWVSLDVHKLSIVAATLPPSGGRPEIVRIENTPEAIRRLISQLGGLEGLAVAYEAGATGWALKRFLDGLGVACDVIAPSLVPVRPGDRVKTDRRDAKKLVRLYRAGELTLVACPTPGARRPQGSDPLPRGSAQRARPRPSAGDQDAAALRAGVHRWQALDGQAPQLGRLAPARRSPGAAGAGDDAHLEMIECQLRQLDVQLDQVAQQDRWKAGVRVLTGFRGIATLTALSLLAEIGDFRRFCNARELMSYLGLCPSEYSSGQSVHRGHITKAGPVHARRLLIEAAWHYRHPPRLTERQRENENAARRDGEPELPAAVCARAWQAQVRSITATASSPNSARSAAPSPTSLSPASSPASSGPP